MSEMRNAVQHQGRGVLWNIGVPLVTATPAVIYYYSKQIESFFKTIPGVIQQKMGSFTGVPNVKLAGRGIGLMDMAPGFTLAACLAIFGFDRPKTTVGITTIATALTVLSNLGHMKLVYGEETLKLCFKAKPEDLSTAAECLNFNTTIESIGKLIKQGMESIKSIRPDQLDNAVTIGSMALIGIGSLYCASKIVKWVRSPSEFQVLFDKAKAGDAGALNIIIDKSYLELMPKRQQEQALELLSNSLHADKDGTLTNQAALLIYYGIGSRRSAQYNIQKSNEIFMLAAQKGNSNALANLGVSFEKGEGCSADIQTAVKLYLEAAEKGNLSAVQHLVRYYEKVGNHNEATRWRNETIKLIKTAA